MIHVTVRTPTVLLPLVWPPPLSLATTRGISVDFFSSGYLDVSVPRVPYVTLWIHVTFHDSSPWGFPHSEICGSKLICSSPQLIAACHVLHRLLMPRHSPYALVRLNFLYNVSHYTMVLFELSEFLWTLRSGLYWLFTHEKTFYSPFALVLSYSTFRWNCIFPFRLERHIIKIICPLLFVFYSNLSSIQLSKIFEPLGSGRSGWTRTIDLALIRRAL